MFIYKADAAKIKALIWRQKNAYANESIAEQEYWLHECIREGLRVTTREYETAARADATSSGMTTCSKGLRAATRGRLFYAMRVSQFYHLQFLKLYCTCVMTDKKAHEEVKKRSHGPIV